MACLRRMADPGDTLATAEIIALEAEHTPEQWLEDRLSYLAAHPEDKYGSGWGLQPPLANSSVTALHQMHEYLGQSTPAEALDMALGAGNVLATISRWGPSENRSAQRRANIERLRGLALQYERSCAATHPPTTIAENAPTATRVIPRKRVRCVPRMLNSSELKVLYPTRWR